LSLGYDFNQTAFNIKYEKKPSQVLVMFNKNTITIPPPPPPQKKYKNYEKDK
jgi:hypothetical protein